MKILGIDTSAVVCSVALSSDRTLLSQVTHNSGLTHSETLLPSVKRVLEEGNIPLSELDAIAISSGPGSFTGLRIGISTVKGLCVTKKIPCLALSTLHALAYNARGLEGVHVCTLMDARRREFYSALFRIENGRPIRLCEDAPRSAEEVASMLDGLDSLFIVGDGAEKFTLLYDRFSSFLAPLKNRYQSGASVALLGFDEAEKDNFITCEELSPRYLRLPQAEREWLEKNK